MFFRSPRSAMRKYPSQDRALHMVDAILDAAAHLFVIHGYEQVSSRDVAERAGASIGSMYQYFPDKEAILGEWSLRQLRSKLGHLAENIDAALADKTLTATQVLENLGQTLVNLSKVNLELKRIIVAYCGRSPYADKDLRTTAITLLQRLAHRLNPGQPLSATQAWVAICALEGALNAALDDDDYLNGPRILNDLVSITRHFVGG